MPKKWITGIDIGRYSTKAAVLFHDGQQLILHHCLELKDSGAIYTDAHCLKHQDTVKTLRQLRKLTPRFHRHVAITVPSVVVNCQQVSLSSSLSPLQIETALYQKLQPSVSQPPMALALDYTSLFEAENSQINNYLVHFAHSAVIDTWHNPFKSVGYKPKLLQPYDSSAQGILQWVASESPIYRHWGLLELGHGHVSFYPPTSLPIHSKASWPLASDISKNGIEDWLTPAMVMKINAHLQQVAAGAQEAGLEGLWLCGGGANMVSEEPQILTHKLKLKITVKPLQLETLITKGRSNIGITPPQFMLSIGCALNGLTWRDGESDAYR